MGWFKRGIDDGVAGQARVVSSSSPHGGRGRTAVKMCAMNLVISAGDIPAFSVEHSQLCRTKRWPYAGTVLPVVVSRSDPSRFEIDFDAVPDHRDVARQRAEQQAAMMRNGGTVTVGGPGVTFVGGTAADIPPEMRAGLEQMLGVDLDGDGTAGAPTDRISQLERLAQLRSSGALTEQEFEAEKRKLLGS